LACIWKLCFQILRKENNLALFYVSNGYISIVQRIFDFDTITIQTDSTLNNWGGKNGKNCTH
jgi:hypothetical protein